MAKKVIVVEDDQSILDLYVEILTGEGYEVHAASSGNEALEILKHLDRPPCVMLTDFMMPNMNGAQLVELIRKDDMLISLPVVIISAEPKIQEKIGKLDYMKKPIELDAIIAKVKEYCGPANGKCVSKEKKIEKVEQEPNTSFS